MRSRRRLLPVVVLTAFVLGVPLAATALGKLPAAITGSATSITDHSVVVRGEVIPETKTTDYQFEYGTTTAYGQATAPVTLTGDHVSTPVTATLDGLAPATTYHFRVKASNKEGVVTGADRSFTTAPTPAAAAPGEGGGDPPVAQAPAPTLGEAVVVAPAAGTVLVKEAGASGFTALRSGDAIPVGSLVDTRAGTVALTTALGGGATQTGRFRGALFQVRQAADGHGLTDLRLRGGDFGACSSAGTARAAARRKPPVRRLWGNDDGGKFRTHGRSSVATVRGTSWVTTDTCAGTRTSVTEGAVSVRDLRRHRTVLVRAGGSYLARSRR
jgi:hypothetical protein